MIPPLVQRAQVAFQHKRRNAGSEPVFGGGRAFRRNTVTSPREPGVLIAAARFLPTMLAQLTAPARKSAPSGWAAVQPSGKKGARLSR
jgi:hypothetical protein